LPARYVFAAGRYRGVVLRAAVVQDGAFYGSTGGWRALCGRWVHLRHVVSPDGNKNSFSLALSLLSSLLSLLSRFFLLRESHTSLRGGPLLCPTRVKICRPGLTPRSGASRRGPWPTPLAKSCTGIGAGIPG
jgi:hypothetical protein